MNHINDWNFDHTLADSERLLNNAARSAGDDAEFSLESILAEFGGQRGLTSELSGDAAVDEGAVPSGTDPQPAVADKVKLQDVLESTVAEVLKEEDRPEPLKPQNRRKLFSRRTLEETEQLYESSLCESEETEQEETADGQDDFRAEGEDEPVEKAVGVYRDLSRSERGASRVAALIVLLMWGGLTLDYLGLMPELYRQERLLWCLPYFVAEALVCLIGRDVFVYACEQLCRGRVTFEFAAALTALVTLSDTMFAFFLPERGFAPFHAIGALGVVFALWGRSLLFRAQYNTFRVAAVGDPNYLVTLTSGGAAKRKGGAEGFGICAEKEDCATRWQASLLPVILVASLVFSALSTLRCADRSAFTWNWSVLLCAANMLAFPLCYAMPLWRLTRRFVKSGSALAGYVGALRLRKSNCVILTDSDLFPPGTVSLAGLKIYGEESGKVISYAATMAHASGSGLSRLFDTLLQSEGTSLVPLEQLNFHEEGGISGLIRGENVMFGTADFCRKMGILLPSGLTLKTGVFLAVDQQLIAVFAIKYLAAENVDWALRALKRNHITPVLAVRDSNITPALLKRKFGVGGALFPTISTRLALSEKDGQGPYALLFREGLMPYAEITVGGKRLVHAVRSATTLSSLGSVISLLLAFYLTFVGAYLTLTPFHMVLYLLLWTFAAMIQSVFVDRY